MNRNATVIVLNFQGHLNSIILEHLKGKTGGFFIECGANDGEFQSNTMYLESKMGWTGLLVEASPVLSRKLLARNRKVSSTFKVFALIRTEVIATRLFDSILYIFSS